MTTATEYAADTIVARATASGRAGIAIVRVSGPGAADIATAVCGQLPRPRYAAYTHFRDGDGGAIDSGIALYFPAPASFTGEDVVELQGHGGPVVSQMLVERVVALGARLAEPGEFTRRAFLNDRIDLNQAEAIADLIDSESRAAASAAQRSLDGAFAHAVQALNGKVTDLRVFVEAAIDFPDEDIDFLDDAGLQARLDDVAEEFERLNHTLHTGRLLRDGIQLVLAGRPNAGKSSLLNALAGHDAAIVTEVPGTTRDVIREFIEIDGLPVHVIDTAGLRDSPGRVEREGIRRTRRQLETADYALVVVDATRPGDSAAVLDDFPAELRHTVVRNKIDLTGEAPGIHTGELTTVHVSALTGAGLDALREHIKQAVGFETVAADTITARQRHIEELAVARQHFDAARTQLLDYRAGELMADELLQVQNALARITGEFTSDDLLGEIFANFCIGK